MAHKIKIKILPKTQQCNRTDWFHWPPTKCNLASRPLQSGIEAPYARNETYEVFYGQHIIAVIAMQATETAVTHTPWHQGVYHRRRRLSWYLQWRFKLLAASGKLILLIVWCNIILASSRTNTNNYWFVYTYSFGGCQRPYLELESNVLYNIICNSLNGVKALRSRSKFAFLYNCLIGIRWRHLYTVHDTDTVHSYPRIMCSFYWLDYCMRYVHQECYLVGC